MVKENKRTKSGNDEKSEKLPSSGEGRKFFRKNIRSDSKKQQQR